MCCIQKTRIKVASSVIQLLFLSDSSRKFHLRRSGDHEVEVSGFSGKDAAVVRGPRMYYSDGTQSTAGCEQ